ncbi:MAG TPA: hypothetical protein VKE92_08580, partial [Anaerolineales bacterium]|nr:hypothetical protein [Anaerolineales bacterium]
MTTNKYPNADTSPERLAEIKGHLANCAFAEPDAHESIRDLLAMLQERQSTINYDRQILHATEDRLCDVRQQLTEAVAHKTALVQQLHDQRWRR